MGHLTYAGSTTYDMDDRTLAHLRAVIVSKLRQRQHFELSWHIDAHAGSGRVALTVDPGIPMEFAFRRVQTERLNPKWLQVMMDAANSPRGLVLMTEEEAMRMEVVEG